MSEVNVGVTVGLQTQKLSNGKTVPGFSVSDVQVSIPSNHLHISIHGNWISTIIKPFIGLFKGTIVHQIEGVLKKELASEVPKALNGVVGKQKGYSELYHGMELDWSIPEAPKVTDSDLEFAIKGLFFEKDKGEVEPVVKPPTNMPEFDKSAPAKFQAFVSTYVLESVSSVFLKVF